MIKMEKPKIGLFSLTCCEGCEIAILDLEDELLELFDKFEVLNFRLGQEKRIDGPYDIAFIEGSISSREDLEAAQHIRDKSKIVVALGTCAVCGGVQAIKNFIDKKSAEEEVYGSNEFLDYKEVLSLEQVIKVDLIIRGCPIDKYEFLEIVKKLLLGVHHAQKEEPVCSECRLNNINCFIENGQKCLGPITYNGCGAPCPHNGTWCIGCRGIMADSNIPAYLKLMKEKGFKTKEIVSFIRMMTGNDPLVKDIERLYKDSYNEKAREATKSSDIQKKEGANNDVRNNERKQEQTKSREDSNESNKNV
ncbi:MAG: NADH:ubiquinone oxidoreductase [Candidatus Woesearchaeota archaeon]